MLILRRPGKDPYFNIAAEEYLMKSVESDCFMLWQNDPSVIIGKHQNTLAEVNIPFVSDRNIPVIRRISGGGTVYHDEGNINFTFISTGLREKLVDYQKFLQPIVEALNQLGIRAKFHGKNDIRINEFKISGNSEHVYKNKVLHHGTLLFSSDLEMLNRVMNESPGKYSDKSVKSVRSKVARITDFLTVSISLDEFLQHIGQFISLKAANPEIRDLSPLEISEISRLAGEKYRTWNWNFGYSPPYIFRNQIQENQQVYCAELHVKSGIIEKTQIKINGKASEINNFFEYLLTGKRHDYHTIRDILHANGLHFNSNKFNFNILLQLLF